MLVHLLRELARELDGLHVRPERTPEHPFEEALDLALDCAKDAHDAGRLPLPSLAAAPSRNRDEIGPRNEQPAEQPRAEDQAHERDGRRPREYERKLEASEARDAEASA